MRESLSTNVQFQPVSVHISGHNITLYSSYRIQYWFFVQKFGEIFPTFKPTLIWCDIAHSPVRKFTKTTRSAGLMDRIKLHAENNH
jgi:hypothetical protein